MKDRGEERLYNEELVGSPRNVQKHEGRSREGWMNLGLIFPLYI